MTAISSASPGRGAEYMGLEGEVGLTTVLIEQAAVADVIQKTGQGQRRGRRVG